MKKILPVIAIFAAVFGGMLVLSFTTARLIQRHDKGGNVVTAAEDDPQLQVAEELARRTFPGFISKLKDGEVQGAVKVKFQSKLGPEYMWVDHIEETQSKDKQMTYKGILADDPKLVTDKKKGDEVSFTDNDVVDWVAKHKDGTIEGNYTEQVLARLQG